MSGVKTSIYISDRNLFQRILALAKTLRRTQNKTIELLLADAVTRTEQRLCAVKDDIERELVL